MRIGHALGERRVENGLAGLDGKRRLMLAKADLEAHAALLFVSLTIRYTNKMAPAALPVKRGAAEAA